MAYPAPDSSAWQTPHGQNYDYESGPGRAGDASEQYYYADGVWHQVVRKPNNPWQWQEGSGQQHDTLPDTFNSAHKVAASTMEQPLAPGEHSSGYTDNTGNIYHQVPTTRVDDSWNTSTLYCKECDDPKRPSIQTRPTWPSWSRMYEIWTNGWVVEIASCLLAIVSLVCITIILAAYQGQPLPDWKFGITINALVAVLGVLLRAGIAIVTAEGISQLKWYWFSSDHPRRLIDMEEFDAASRGFWGSLLFMFRTEGAGGKHSWSQPWQLTKSMFSWHWSGFPDSLAKVAAAITVLCLAIDPFTQQIMQNKPCVQGRETLDPILSRTNTYSATGGHIGAGPPAIDSQMGVAINTGLVNPPLDVSSLISAKCPTANCDIPTFSTLAVCHECQDITSSIKVVHKPKSWPNISIPIPDTDDTNGTRLSLSTGSLLSSAVTSVGDADFTNVDILAIPEQELYNERYESAVAFSCRLRPCVRTLRGKIVNSTLAEVELSRHMIGFNELFGSVDQDVVAKLAITQLETHNSTTESGQQCTGSPSKTMDHPIEVAKANVDLAPTGSSSQTTQQNQSSLWFAESCVWQITYGSLSSIRVSLYDSLDDQGVYMTGGALESSLVSRRMFNDGEPTFASTDKFWQDLSDVMTATIRAHGGPDHDSAGEFALGTVLESKTCLAVGWAWLAYPAALVGMCTMWLATFLVWHRLHKDSVAGPDRGVLIRNAWKSSSLPLLLTNVSDHRNAQIGGDDGSRLGRGELFDMSKCRMENLARDMEVRLVRDDSGKPKLE